MADLFDYLPQAASAADPVTSSEAAKALERSGARAAQTRAVADAVRQFPGLTSRELAERAGVDRHMVARRLPDAASVGLVRRGDPRPCAASGGRRRAVTWFPAGQAG